MEDIDIKGLLLIARKRWWIVLVVTLVAAIAAAGVSFFVLQPVYQSHTSLYVGRNVDTQSTIAYSDVMLNTQLVNDYRELVKSRMVAAIVIEKLGLKGITPDQLAAKLGVNSKKDTRLIVISAQDIDPVLARNIVQSVAEVFTQKAVEIIKVENVQIIDGAEVPESPVKPNKKMNVAIAAVLGMMLSVGIIFLIEFLDNTIKTPEDVEKYTGLPVIGTIPKFPE